MIKEEKKKNSFGLIDDSQTVENDDPELQARTFSGRFLEAGIVGYNDVLYLIRRENLESFAKGFKGLHMVLNHYDIIDGQGKNMIVGYVSNVYLNLDDGWMWCDFILTSKEAIKRVETGYDLSCAYEESGNMVEGIYNGQTYKSEIITCKKYLHMAIVEKGRYENSQIKKNSITNIKENIMQLFKFNDKKVETKELEIPAENALFEMGDGNNVSFKDLRDNYVRYNEAEQKKEEDKKNEEEKKKEEDKKLNADDEVDIDGKKVKISELVNTYKNSMKKNQEAEQKKEEDKKNEEDKEKAEKEDKEKEDKKKNEAIKKNSADFYKIKKEVNNNDINDKVETPIALDSSLREAGSLLYGSQS